MSQSAKTNIYLVNALGQVIRSYNWSANKIILVLRADTRRVEAVSSLIELDQKNIPYHILAEGTISQIKNSPLSLGKYGSLMASSDSNIEVSPSVFGQNEDNSIFTTLLKKTALTHLILLAFILTFSWTYNNFFKTTMVTVKVQPKLVKTKVAKKKIIKARRVVKASKKKINRKKKVSRKIVKRRSIKRTKRVKTARNSKIRVKRKRVKSYNVHTVGALSALGGLKKGRRGGRGLNLNSVKNYSGSGKGAGVKSKGLSTPGLQGRGLIARSSGGGKTVRSKYGYGTKGRAGGAAGYGKHTIAGGSGSYFHPLQELGEVAGGLERSQIAAVINRNIGQVIYCYEKGLQKQPKLSGRVSVAFIISGNGRVSVASIAKSSLRHRKVERCITKKLKAWRFPKPHGRVDVNVTYPFILKRVSQG